MIISVRDGKTPYIGANGNWWIGDTDTGVRADAESYTETDPTVPAWAKAASKPTYTYSEVGAAAASHSHAISEVTNLQTTLDGKAASSHTHATSDVTGLTDLLSGCGQVATGSYTGTGTYGSSNPSSITCPFVPRVFFAGVPTGHLSNSGSGLMYVEGIEDASQYWSINGNTVSWYTSATNAGASNQCNAKGTVYYWFAIG